MSVKLIMPVNTENDLSLSNDQGLKHSSQTTDSLENIFQPTSKNDCARFLKKNVFSFTLRGHRKTSHASFIEQFEKPQFNMAQIFYMNVKIYPHF